MEIGNQRNTSGWNMFSWAWRENLFLDILFFSILLFLILLSGDYLLITIVSKFLVSSNVADFYIFSFLKLYYWYLGCQWSYRIIDVVPYSSKMSINHMCGNCVKDIQIFQRLRNWGTKSVSNLFKFYSFVSRQMLYLISMSSYTILWTLFIYYYLIPPG